ncbi:MAG: hypothetical protein ACLUEQ_07905 [Cloacibacillus evryensis]
MITSTRAAIQRCHRHGQIRAAFILTFAHRRQHRHAEGGGPHEAGADGSGTVWPDPRQIVAGTAPVAAVMNAGSGTDWQDRVVPRCISLQDIVGARGGGDVV